MYYNQEDIEKIREEIDYREYLAYAESITYTLPYDLPVIQDLLLLAIYVTENLPQPDSDIIDFYMETDYQSNIVRLSVRQWHNITLIDNTLRELLTEHYGVNEDIGLDYTYAITCMHFYLLSSFIINYVVNESLLVAMPVDKDNLERIYNFIDKIESNIN